MNKKMSIQQHIESTAFLLFSQRGIKSVSMDEIAKNAGVSKKTIYTYYGRKEDLLISCLEKTVIEMKAEFKKIKSSDENSLLKILKMYSYGIKKIFSYHFSGQFSIKKYYFKAHQLNDGFQNEFFSTTISSLLKQANIEGIVRDDVKIEFVCQLHKMKLTEMVEENFEIYRKVGPDVVISQIIVNNLRGMLTKKYYGLFDNSIQNKPKK